MDPFQQNIGPQSARTQGDIIERAQILISQSNQPGNLSTQQNFQQKPLKSQKEQIPTGWTKLIKLSYYKQYFQISQQEVFQRILYSVKIPYQSQFTQIIRFKPDFYSPFWILTTIITLLGFVQNFSNYLLSKFIMNENLSKYFFSLEHARQAITLMYSFGLGVPISIYFILKFTRTTQNQEKHKQLPIVNIICLYGYSIFCYIPALLCCIIPLSFLQWLFLLIAFGSSTFFLIINLLKYIQGAKQILVVSLIAGMQLILLLCIKLIFIQIYNS